MSDDTNTPEPGQRCRVTADQGEEIAVWTGHMWASEDGSRIIESETIESWEEAPHEGDLQIIRQDEEE